MRLLEKIADGRPLNQDEAFEAAMEMLVNPGEAETAALLMGMRVRGEKSEEIAGFSKALRHMCVKVPLEVDAIDTAGTGGDGMGTVNVSTASALLAAYMGVKVLKHGNRSVSSSSGSADFLEGLGFRISLSPGAVADMVSKINFGFAFAQLFHPAMKSVAPVRRKLGVRTIFNLVGPLSNPGMVRRQVMGVASPGLLGEIAGAAVLLGYDRLLLIHGEPGMDEASVVGRTTIVEVRRGRVERYEISPGDAGLPTRRLEELLAANPSDSVRKVMDGLTNRNEAVRDFIALNTALALIVGGRARDVRDGVEQSIQAIEGGGVVDFIARAAEASRNAA